MTRPLTDEQLDKLRARVSTVHPPARIGKADAHEMMHNTPACVVYAIQDLFRRLDHEHAAHQVTQAELEAAQRYIESLEIALRDYRFTTEEAEELELSGRLYRAARAGQGEGESCG